MSPIMSVTFSYTGQLAAAAGTADESVEIPETGKLRPVLDQLAEKHGEEYAELIFDREGKIRPTLLVVLDGIQSGGDKESMTIDGVDSVMLMTPIAGG